MKITKKDRELEFSKKEHDAKIEKSLENYSYWLIVVIGVVGTIIGLILIGAFWYWGIKMLYKVSA